MDIIVGRTGASICPVSALLDFIALRQDCPGPFFLDTQGRTVTKK